MRARHPSIADDSLTGDQPLQMVMSSGVTTRGSPNAANARARRRFASRTVDTSSVSFTKVKEGFLRLHIFDVPAEPPGVPTPPSITPEAPYP